MNIIKLKIFFILLILLFFQIDIHAQTTNNTNLKDWSIENSVSVKRFQPNYFDDQPIFPSPDGKYFYFVSVRQNLEIDRYDYTMHFFKFNDILDALKKNGKAAIHSLKPFREITLSSLFFQTPWDAENYGWTQDSKSVIFQMCDAFNDAYSEFNKLEYSYLYKYTIENDALISIDKRLMSEGRIDKILSQSHNGKELVYSVLKNKKAEDYLTDYRNEYPFAVIDEQQRKRDYQALFQFIPTVEEQTMYLYKNGTVVKLPEVQNLWMSPDGLAMLILENNKLNQSKNELYSKRIYNFKWIKTSNIVDGKFKATLKGGISNIFTTKPQDVKVVWTPDSKMAIITNAFKKDLKDSLEENINIISVDTQNDNTPLITSVLKNKAIDKIFWSDKKELLVAKYKDSSNINSFVSYKPNNGSWIEKNVQESELSMYMPTAKIPDGLHISIKEDINTAPMVVASKDGNNIFLSEPDEELSDVYIAPTKEITWEVDGVEHKAGLTLPRSSKAIKPFPLIVQHYYYDPNVFNPAGGGDNHAKQTFVANGYAVLETELSLNEILGRFGKDCKGCFSKEGPIFNKTLQAVIKKLVEEGTVDKEKIGLLGFSRGGFEILYAITHPQEFTYATAYIHDAFTGSFIDGMNSLSSMGGLWSSKSDNYWEDKEAWMEHEPLFNINKIKTPLYYAQHGYHRDNFLTNMGIQTFYTEFANAFRMNQKPLEVVMYPRSRHPLTYPREFKAGIEAALDWMNFWIKGIDDPVSTKKDQYTRWHKLRLMQDENLKKINSTDKNANN